MTTRILFIAALVMSQANGRELKRAKSEATPEEQALQSLRERSLRDLEPYLDEETYKKLATDLADPEGAGGVYRGSLGRELNEKIGRAAILQNDLRKSLQTGTFQDLELALAYPQFVKTMILEKAGKELERLPRLETIRLSGNLPRDPIKLKSLNSLFLEGPEATDFPPWVWHLDALTALRIGETLHKSLPREIARLKNLRDLSVGSRALKELPAEIGELTQLENLRVYSKGVKELPRSIGNLSQLKSLSIDKSGITSLPPEIGKLKQLKYLRFEFSDLRTLPPEIGQLESLERIDGASAGLTRVPEEIGNLKKLKVIELHSGGGRNRISDFPWKALTSLPALEYLYCAGNPVKRFPDAVGRLRHGGNGNYYIPAPTPAAKALDPRELKERLLSLHAAGKTEELIEILRDTYLVPWHTGEVVTTAGDFFNDYDTVLGVDLFEQELFFMKGEKQRSDEILFQVRIVDNVTAYHALAVFYLDKGVWTLAPRTYIVEKRDKTEPPFRFSFAPIYGSKDSRKGLVGVIQEWAPHDFTQNVVVLFANLNGVSEGVNEALNSPEMDSYESDHRLIIKPRSASLRIKVCPDSDKRSCKTKVVKI